MPGAIIFVNSHISDVQKTFIAQQLYAEEVISKAEFDARVAADPNYPSIIKNLKMRVVVILETFQDFHNRELADVALFFKNGLVSIEYLKNGPPKFTIDQLRLDAYTILRYVKSDEVVVLPFYNNSCGCSSPCEKCCSDPNCPSCRAHGVGGIFEIELRGETSGVHAPNCDNLAHNEKFKSRPS